MAFLITEENFSIAWLRAKDFILGQPGKETFNLMVTILNPLQRDSRVHLLYEQFCEGSGINKPNKVAATIFPKRCFKILGNDRERLYRNYPRIHRVLKGNWGSYFNQMINWENATGNRNQLEDIIVMINDRSRIYKTAYVIQIPNPFKHLGWTRGLPCLYQILIQLEDNNMSFLAVYRNHDFGEKAYGNYMGLGHLLEFIAGETNFEIGSISCISSHAFVQSKHVAGLRAITLGEE